MRLWSEQLLKKLPRQQLLGQHREVAALRGNGWMKPHRTINYIFRYDMEKLFAYHVRVINEMTRRGYKASREWLNPNYRGKVCSSYNSDIGKIADYLSKSVIYDEHNDEYLQECIENLQGKGILIQ